MRSPHASAPVHPRRRWYWVAGCLLATAAACIALGILGFFGLDQQVHDFQRVSVPGHAMVTFTRPGGYVLYIERPGSCCSFNIGSGGNDTNSGDGPPFSGWSMRVALLPVSGGSPVPISTWRDATESYAAAGRQGQTAMYFTIRSPGQYYLAASDVSPRSITDIAAGRGIGHGVFVQVLLIVLGLFIFGPAGLLTGGITLYRRHRARRAPPPASWNAPVGPAVLPASEGWHPGQAQAHGGQGSDDAGWASQVLGHETAQAAPPAWPPPAWAPPPGAAVGPYQEFTAPEFTAPAASAGTVLPPGMLVPPSPLLPPGPLLPPSPLQAPGQSPLFSPSPAPFGPSAPDGAGAPASSGAPAQPSPPGLSSAPPQVPSAPPAAGPAHRPAVPPRPTWPPPPTAPPLAAPPPGPLPEAAGHALRRAPAAGQPARVGRARPLGRISWRRKRLLPVGIGVAILAAFLISSALTGPAPATRSSVGGPDTLPAASAPATQAPPAPSTAPESLTRSERWLNGLTSLNTHMNHAMGPASSTVTSASLRLQARQLGRCSAELAGIGPPTARQRPLYHLARQACAGYELGAKCDLAAARDSAGLNSTGVKPQARFMRLLNCSDAGMNKGIKFLSDALSNGSAEG